MNKRFTDLFIARPVLAMVVSLLIFLLGIKSLLDLEVRQYPKIDSTLITITTSYPGAPPDLIEGFITQQIERSVATSEGIDYMTSQSTDGQSLINVYVKLNYDANTAFTDVMSKVQQVQNFLPTQAQLPVLNKQSITTTSLMFIAFDSDKMSAEQITDYLTRVVQPKLVTVNGVASAAILGAKTFTMRIWLNTKKMAALSVTPTDVARVLMANNYQSAAGAIKGDFLQLTINATTSGYNVHDFENMVIKSSNNTLVRMSDIGKAELGSLTYDTSVYLNGNSAVFIGITPTPVANPLTVISDVKKLLPQLEEVYPPTLISKVVYDATKYINSSIIDVIRTIVEASVIVIVVMFLFLGSVRAVIIPVVTIPLSLIGVMFFMYMLHYSINLLTLLAMVLAIGLVVDDAIVVVENVHRHIEEGLKPFDAAILGAREIATAVIAMTITLAAVYAPIGFMTGLTGALFIEFAFTLAGSVIVSGIIALTLSPMMCSRLLKISPSKFAQFVDRQFDRFKGVYHNVLHNVLDMRGVVLVVAIFVLLSCFGFYMLIPSQLAPTEDQGVLLITGTAPDYANITYVERYSSQFNDIVKEFPAGEDNFVLNGAGPSGSSAVNVVFAGMIFKPWDERTQTQFQVLPEFQKKLNQVTGLRTVAFPLPSLPGAGSGLPVQFVLQTVGPFTELYQVAEKIREDARRSGLFLYVDSSLLIDKPEIIVDVNRNMAGILGITMQDIGSALAVAYGGNYVNWFPMQGLNYKVVPQVQQKFRLVPEDINNLYIRTGTSSQPTGSSGAGGGTSNLAAASNSDSSSGLSPTSGIALGSGSGTVGTFAYIPLSTLATLKQTVVPNQLTHFQQLNSATIEGVLGPLVTMGQALDFLRATAKKYMPQSMTFDYAGESRQFVQEGSGLIVTLFISIIVIYLVLSAQFESFRDPFIILISVPMSICGALIVLNIGSTWSSALTINIYTQVGLITLIGLISKHGILMVEFANQLQAHEGLSIREAIEKSAATRLRPILMTTAAMVLGVIPLLLAHGAGAQSRLAIGVVIFTGMLIGTFFTLFVVPTMYTFIAKKHTPPPEVPEHVE